MDECECGFNDDAVELDEIGARARVGVDEILRRLAHDPNAGQRPAVDRWSTLE